MIARLNCLLLLLKFFIFLQITRGSFKTSKKVNSLASELHTSAFERRHFYANHPVAAVRLWAKSHRVQDGPAAVSQ